MRPNRPNDTYRPARRNAARAARKLGAWKSVGLEAHNANMAAELPERRKTCTAATSALAKFIAQSPRTLTAFDISSALLTFWRKQPNTRVASRIVKGLAAAARPGNRRARA
jgi:hypothetical protein